MKSKFLRYSSLALALGLASGTALAQEKFSQTIFFGDSLTDTGRMDSIIKGSLIAYYALPSTYGAFTTNPDGTWATHLAQAYGDEAIANTPKNPNGKNHAVGGARASETVNKLVLSIPSTKTQIENYLTKTEGKADPKALYTVWVGANDLLAASEALKKNPNDQLKALSIITDAAKSQADLVEKLHQAGASYILVPNIPDVGLTPRFVKDEKTSAQGTQAAQIYNNTLYQALSNKGANVITANTFALLQEAVHDKEGFGFKNVDDTACNHLSVLIGSLACDQSEWKSPTANEDYAFADDIHPSGRTHRILAQYYQSLIDSPSAFAQLPTKFITDGHRLNRQLNRRLNSLDQYTHSVWLDADIDNSHVLGSQNDKPSFLIGLDFGGNNSVTGFYLRRNKQDLNLSNTTSADIKQVGFGLYHQHHFGAVNIKASIGVDRLKAQTDRQVIWEGAERSHQGTAEGRRYQASLQAGYDVAAGKVTIKPYIGVQAQKVRLDDITEDQPHLSTALRIHQQTQKSLQGKIGVDWSYDVSDQAQVFAGLERSKEFEDEPRTVTASVLSIKNYHSGFTLPVTDNQVKDSTNMHLGAKYKLGQTSLTAGVNAERKDSRYDLGGFIGLQSQF